MHGEKVTREKKEFSTTHQEIPSFHSDGKKQFIELTKTNAMGRQSNKALFKERQNFKTISATVTDSKPSIKKSLV